LGGGREDQINQSNSMKRLSSYTKRDARTTMRDGKAKKGRDLFWDGFDRG